MGMALPAWTGTSVPSASRTKSVPKRRSSQSGGITTASRVPVALVKLLACVASATLAAFAGMVLGGRLVAGSPTLANEFLLPAVAAVVVGGTALTGGVGSVWRTLIGALIVSVVRVGMTFLGVDVFVQQIVLGIVLILAVWITIDRAKIPIVK